MKLDKIMVENPQREASLLSLAPVVNSLMVTDHYKTIR